MPRILDFKSKPGLRVSAKKGDTSAEIILYGGIGTDYWGDGSMVSAKDFSNQLKAIDPSVTEISLRINSNGGDVFDGIAIYNRLVQHKANITVYIDGLAASIASIIALAGNEIIIGEGAIYMVHLPWTFAMGNRMEMDNTVQRLMDVEEQMISIYAKKSGMDRAEIKSLLEAETWMGSDQAIELGFVDSKAEDSLPIAASVFDARWINKAPKNYKSETKVIAQEIEKLKKKIEAKIARK